MSKPDQTRPRDASDALMGFVDSTARLVMYVGLAALIVGAGYLIYTAAQGAIGSELILEKARNNIKVFGQIAVLGSFAAAAGSSWLLWGEETLGPLQLTLGGGLFFSPYYLPTILEIPANTTADQAIEATATAGMPLAVAGVLVVVVDLIIRMRTRIQQGARADQLKIGRGMKEEKDIRNVFLGKCWQLPYCRKFVRERCPIYHARRSCWNERVGCMCEESVIQNAMEGKVIPSDIVAAAQYIPKNAKLTPAQKAERCRQCVIYNEHQKHKYQLSLPAAGFGLIGLYIAMREPMKSAVQGVLIEMDSIMGGTRLDPVGVTGSASKITSLTEGVIPYADIILVAMFLIIFAYIVRLIEFMFFKLKI